ncbi:dTDP-4-dehydrorhamnose reductase [Cyanobium sp. Morenito 9A2]|uniref:dTDP-4-dehydrorhamnose reductase n=1 Tax=Cyanobium sp. Morenito 9A2 TaxID=2823718 RepID=UPI0020CE1AE5|nr:dTDP-4-dehydrorhamnose reductase [Cyanobium sp. Morenito 9A2]MCP9849765.1 dTDP-4-dehydrorhamnose reductase [Cyanobium sp. Morenito 9A2]
MSSPLLLIGRQGQVASALRRCMIQRHGPGLPPPPLVVAGRPELDLAAPVTELAPQLAALLDGHRPALVLNAAAYTAVDRAETESELAHAINATAVGLLAAACAQRNLPLLHLSTDYVFAGGGERPWQEDDPTGPLGVYGASKLAGEQALRAAGGPHLLLRVSWVFGLEGANFVRTMLRLGAERPALSVVADQSGGPTSAEAIARTLLTLAEPASVGVLPDGRPFPWGTYHYSGQPAVSWHGFAAEIFRQALELGLLTRAPELSAIPTSAYPTPAARPANSRLDGSRFQSTFGLPLPDWREDLRQCLSAWDGEP